jgi:wobble nucleotide-excising tRNase
LYDPTNEKFGHCSLVRKNNQELKTLVYNKDFRDRNFGNGKLKGIFTLGEATTEQIKEIETKTESLKQIKEDYTKKGITKKTQEDKKQECEDEFKEFCWNDIYKKNEGIFKEAFRGFLQKENFKTKLLQEFSSNTVPILPYAELEEKARTVFGEVPQNISPINTIIFDRLIEIEKDPIWKKIIVGKADVDIAKLIQKLDINDWVNQGRDYIPENSETCPFCQQQTITNEFRKQLVIFFDETYLNDIKALKTLKLEYDSLLQNIIDELNTIESNQKNSNDTKLDIDRFSTCLKTLSSQGVGNREYLNNKEKEPSRNIELISLKEQLDMIAELISIANDAIKKHNNIVINFNAEKGNLIKSVWKFIIEKNKDKINEYKKQLNGLTTGITNLEQEINIKIKKYNELDTEIKNLSKNVTSTQPTINEINRLLKSYSFLNFEIVPAKENGFYQIQREDGTIAETTLSEGEITFITFLYYLQLTKGGISEETVNEERILIIDDPISSLDSNVLFVVGSLIKEIIKNIKTDTGNIRQLLLLTHNIYFHKEVSFIDGRTKKCNVTNYWILRKNDKISTIQFFGMENPILSSYELLWKELKSDGVKSCITIQNIMRRIIENYFKLLGKYGDDDLIQKFNTKEEQEICRSLICWINDGSHSISDDLFVELQNNIIDNYKKVFKSIFDITNNSGHYSMMMGINETNGNL